jgi:hypothetical protein
MSSTVKTEPSTVEIKSEPSQHIYIIQTSDGSIPVEAGEVLVADETIYETVSALEQLSRGQIVATEGGELLQVYEEVVLPDGGPGGDMVDVAEVEVGDGRSASPVKIGALSGAGPKSRRKKNQPQPPPQTTMYMIQQVRLCLCSNPDLGPLFGTLIWDPDLGP